MLDHATLKILAGKKTAFSIHFIFWVTISGQQPGLLQCISEPVNLQRGC